MTVLTRISLSSKPEIRLERRSVTPLKVQKHPLSGMISVHASRAWSAGAWEACAKRGVREGIYTTVRSSGGIPGLYPPSLGPSGREIAQFYTQDSRRKQGEIAQFYTQDSRENREK